MTATATIAAPTDVTVGPGKRVTLHFTLKLANGDLIDSTDGRAPATFEFGDGNLLPGFERQLLGLRAGDRGSFTVWPEDAFGQPNPANLQQFKRSQFAGVELEEGLMLSFADASQSELPGVVVAFDEQEVTVDFNHPLAGRPIQFDVEITAVEKLG